MGTMITLKSSNCQVWKTMMLDLLYREDLFLPVVNMGKMPEGGEENEWKLMNRRATATIRHWVGDSLIHHVFEETDAYLIWKKLEDLFERKDAWISEVRKLMNLKYKDGQSVVKYLNDVKALILLSSLPFSLADSVLSLCDSAHGSKLKLETVMCSILNAAKQGKHQFG